MRPEIQEEVDKAVDEYVAEVTSILVAFAVTAYMLGELHAHYYLPNYILYPAQHQYYAYEYVQQYKNLLIREGATIIDGEKVSWLKDMSIELRRQIADVIDNGLKFNKPVDTVTRELETFIVGKRSSQIALIAQNEIITLRNRGMDKLYENARVEWVQYKQPGINPCILCASRKDKVYLRSDAPFLPAHPRCPDYYVPYK